MRRNISNLIAISFMLCMGYTGATDPSPLKVLTKRDTDKVNVGAENGKTLLAIRSPTGISRAVIERRADDWPDTVMLRLHLRGLENLKITNGKETLEVSVSSHDVNVRQWKDGKEEEPLDSNHPHSVEVRMIGKEGKPVKTIPLIGGYFEIQLPEALFEDNPKSITVNWIDFYR